MRGPVTVFFFTCRVYALLKRERKKKWLGDNRRVCSLTHLSRLPATLSRTVPGIYADREKVVVRDVSRGLLDPAAAVMLGLQSAHRTYGEFINCTFSFIYFYFLLSGYISFRGRCMFPTALLWRGSSFMDKPRAMERRPALVVLLVLLGFSTLTCGE